VLVKQCSNEYDRRTVPFGTHPPSEAVTMTSAPDSRSEAPTPAPCGTWASPITSDLIVSSFVGLAEIRADGDDLYWRELRPREGGRGVIVRHSTADGETHDLTPADFYVRTRVNEYGGGAWWVRDGVVVFSNFEDQRLYLQRPEDAPQPLTAAGPMRYADASLDTALQRLVCVREAHGTGGEPETTLVGLSLDPRANRYGEVIASGRDFYAAPRVSPDGHRLAWLCWDHPHMPWDHTELWVADFDANGELENARRIVGENRESIQQPRWTPEGELVFVSDRSGWWNLYRWREDRVEPLLEREAEIGRPMWVLGASSYDFIDDTTLVCAVHQADGAHFVRVSMETGRTQPIEALVADAGSICAVPQQDAFVCRVRSVDRPDTFERVNAASGARKVLRSAGRLPVSRNWFSIPEPISFPTPTADGPDRAYGWYYPPANPNASVPDGERPPLLVRCHGGPTSAASPSLELGIQYWTSRGFAVADINYRGSSGHGRAYREKLLGQWGVADVEDCKAAVRWLVDQGRVDPDRLTIEGRSAGGMTVLLALAHTETPFAAGASHFGVSDLGLLAQSTHKFESRYLDGLIGPWPAAREVYEARSPITHADALACPIIFFQGDEDRIVPPTQSERMAEALRAKGVPVAYICFEGEQHGFRRAAHIQRALDAQFYFFARCFGFEPAEAIDPVPIDNLDD